MRWFRTAPPCLPVAPKMSTAFDMVGLDVPYGGCGRSDFKMTYEVHRMLWKVRRSPEIRWFISCCHNLRFQIIHASRLISVSFSLRWCFKYERTHLCTASRRVLELVIRAQSGKVAQLAPHGKRVCLISSIPPCHFGPVFRQHGYRNGGDLDNGFNHYARTEMFSLPQGVCNGSKNKELHCNLIFFLN